MNMKKGLLIIGLVIIVCIVLIILFRPVQMTGYAVINTEDIVKKNYTSQILDLIQKNIELSLNDKYSKLDTKELRENAERDLIEIKRLNERLKLIETPLGYEEVNIHLKKNYEYLIKALELAIESSNDEDEAKLKLAIDYIKRSNEENKAATELLRNI